MRISPIGETMKSESIVVGVGNGGYNQHANENVDHDDNHDARDDY